MGNAVTAYILEPCTIKWLNEQLSRPQLRALKEINTQQLYGLASKGDHAQYFHLEDRQRKRENVIVKNNIMPRLIKLGLVAEHEELYAYNLATEIKVPEITDLGKAVLNVEE